MLAIISHNSKMSIFTVMEILLWILHNKFQPKGV